MTACIIDEADSGRHSRDTVSCYTHGGVRIERYICASNEQRSVDRHSHEEYQFGLSSTDAATYRYRGSEH
ncbi:MAG TPA: hypothetical protein VGO46_09645, partial [Gemmatimonadaceae bacterium]|nr:hypothetical protein [Gemmatimonadaceae bacterium]